VFSSRAFRIDFAGLLFVLLAAIGVATPSSLVAQAKPMTITSLNGMTYMGSSDEETCYYSGECETHTVRHYLFNFTVKNTGSDARYLYVSPGCSYCSPPAGGRGSLDPNQTASVYVYADFPESQSGSATVGLTVAAAAATGWTYNYSTNSYEPTGYQLLDPWDSYSVPITVASGVATLPPIPADFRPAVTPKTTTEIIPFSAALSRSFTIQNAGTRSATYAITAACGSISNCAPSKTSTTLAPGATDAVSVSFTSPGTVSASNVVQLIAAATNTGSQGIADTGSRPTATPALRPSVGPKNGSPVKALDGIGSATFNVSNNGQLSDGFTYTPICEGWATACSVSSVATGDGEYSVSVSFQTPAAIGSPTYPTATIRLIATLGIAADTGWVPAILGYTKPSITPKTTNISDPAALLKVSGFNITNTGNVTSSYSFAASCTGAITNCWSTPAGATVVPGATTNFTLQYNAPPMGQTGTFRLIATHQSGNSAFVEADTAWINSTGADVVAPVLTVTGAPAEGTSTISGALAIGVNACDADGQIANPTATINGTAGSTTFTSISQGGCTTAKTGTFPLTAQPGANTLVVAVSDGAHTTTTTRHFTYDESYEASPAVTYQNQSRLVRNGIQSADTFYVHNTGPIAIQYSVAAACTAQLLNCTISNSTLTLAAGQTGKVWITYTTTATGPTATVWPIVSYTGTTGRAVVVNDVYTSLYVDQIAPVITMTSPGSGATINYFPTIAMNWCDADGVLNSHTVTLDGASIGAETFVAQSQGGCTSAGVSSWPNVSIGLGTHTVVATATDVSGHTTTSSLTFTLALPPVADFQPHVTPRTSSVYLIPNTQTITWAVKNNGTRSAQYHLTPDCSALTTVGGCQLDHSDVALAAGAVDSVRMTFVMTALPSSSKTLKLIARYQDIVGRAAADTGTVAGNIPTFAQLYQPEMLSQTPLVWSVPASDDNGHYITLFTFPVRNAGVAPVTYHVDVQTTGGFGFVPWLIPATTITVNPGETVNYIVEPMSPTSAGITGAITVTVSYSEAGHGTLSDSKTSYLTTTAPVYGLVVTPKNADLRVNATSPKEVVFVVTSMGTSSIQVDVNFTCTGLATNCRRHTPGGDSTGTFTLGVGRPGDSVHIRFDLPADTVNTRSGRVTLSAHGQGTHTDIADMAVYSVSLAGAYGVRVTPDSAARPPIPPGQVFTQRFAVINTGIQTAAFNLTVACSNGVAACSAPGTPSYHTASLISGDSAIVDVVGHALTLGMAGTMRLTATNDAISTVSATGVVTTTIAIPPRIAVEARGLNTGPAIARDQCLTIAAGDNAAYECGDLRIVHALPTTTTMNKARTPALLYNSAHATARGLIAADVLVSQGPPLGGLHATLVITNAAGSPVTLPYRAFSDTIFSDTSRRRLVIPFDASAIQLTSASQPFGAFKYMLEVRSVSDTSQFAKDSGTVIVVDRSATPFGKGWWLDGLERLSMVTPDSLQRLWIGGDGSARLYEPVRDTIHSDTIWVVKPTLDRPDTLTVTRSAGVTTYHRHLPNGAHVDFNGFGQQIATVNRQGQVTSFGYDGNQNLSTITLPKPIGSSATRTYTFGYTQFGSSYRLTSVDAPAADTVRHVAIRSVAATDGSRAVDRITDADGKYIGFELESDGRIKSRTDRRAFKTTFDFESGGLQRSTLVMAPQNIVHTFCAAETASLSSCLSSGGLPKSRTVRTLYDGPRDPSDVRDTTAFYLTTYGAPAKIIDALGHVTTIERKNSIWPLLSTAVVQPNLHRVESVYDPARALILTTTDVNPLRRAASDSNAITHYAWNTTRLAFNLLEHITSPSGEVSNFGYNDSGDREWQEDGRGAMSRTLFTYNSNRQLETVLPAGNASGQVQRLDYDVSGVGNLKSTTSPHGIHAFLHTDAIGRVDSSRTQIDATHFRVQATRFDVMDLAKTQVDSAPAVGNAPASWLIVRSAYDSAGNLTRLTQTGVPDPAHIDSVVRIFQYDGASRKISESGFHPTGGVREIYHWTYDPASNLITGGHDAVGATLVYDALNRVTSRNGAHSATYTYAPTTGLLETANNSAARVKRSYYPGGALETDSLWIATADTVTPDFTKHVYGLRSTYDLEGRRTVLQHPSQLLNTGSTSYAYDNTSHRISITDKFNSHYQYDFTPTGEIQRFITHVGEVNQFTDTTGYDEDGRRSYRKIHDITGNGPAEAIQLDDGGRVVRVGADTITYDGRGRVVRSQFALGIEQLTVDAFGNTTQKAGPQASLTSSAYIKGYGTLSQQSSPGAQIGNNITMFGFELGKLTQTISLVASGHASGTGQGLDAQTFRSTVDDIFDDRNLLVEHRFVYDTVSAQIDQILPDSPVRPGQYRSTETYRYDALGRRVWVRMARDSVCHNLGTPEQLSGCANTITRTVWDGDQILYEIRSPSGDGVSATTMESDAATGDYVGVVGYVHGLGIDAPLALDKDGEVVLPIADWRGGFAMGVCGMAACASTHVKFPARTLLGPAATFTYTWYGSLIMGGQDGSGYQYRRNRLYNPTTGQFTQEDPIGLAGGMNLYGFAGGDPVNFSDPFGLCPEWVDGKPCDLNAVASFAAGFGDAVSFGATNWVRDKMGTNDVVDKDGAAYFGGQVGGFVAGAALGSATAGAIREGGTLATSGPVRSLATKALSSDAGRALFGKGGSMNAGRAFRMGVSKGKEGRMVFRMAGEAVESAAGTNHIDLIDLGRIVDYLKTIPK